MRQRKARRLRSTKGKSMLRAERLNEEYENGNKGLKILKTKGNMILEYN
jgi:hypothetical protein